MDLGSIARGPVPQHAKGDLMAEKTEKRMDGNLAWKARTTGAEAYEQAELGDFEKGDGVRFTLSHYPTCYRRGPWRLLVEVAPGPKHMAWGCFDEQDSPMRWYHLEESARREAKAIADVLVRDRERARSG